MATKASPFDLSTEFLLVVLLTFLIVAPGSGFGTDTLLSGQNHHHRSRSRSWRHRRYAGKSHDALLAKTYSRKSHHC